MTRYSYEENRALGGRGDDLEIALARLVEEIASDRAATVEGSAAYVDAVALLRGMKLATTVEMLAKCGLATPPAPKKPWIVWVDGAYGPTVTNVRAETMKDAVAHCVVYAVEHGGSAEQTWCACFDTGANPLASDGSYEKMEHPPRKFSRFRASANGQDVVKYEDVERIGDNTDAYGR